MQEEARKRLHWSMEAEGKFNVLVTETYDDLMEE